MKRYFCLILSILIFISYININSINVYALSNNGKCGEDVYYSYNEQNKILTLYGFGDMFNYDGFEFVSPFFDNNEIIAINITDGITNIGDYAFDSCLNLEKVSLPNSVKTIGKYSFRNCTQLENISIPNSVNLIKEGAFDACIGLSSVEIPNSVNTIGMNAFCNCTNLNTLFIPNSVTDIGENAFFNVNKISYNGIASGSPWGAISVSDDYMCGDNSRYSFDYNTKTLYISGYGDMYNYNCNDSISPFCEDKDIVNLVIEDGITSIGDYAFYYCTQLANIVLPNSLTRIGRSSFSNCHNLTNITFGDCLTNIDSLAFEQCRNLNNIRIPSSVLNIGYYAFYGVDTVLYSGIANGSPWGANKIINDNRCGENITCCYDSNVDKLILTGYGEMFDYENDSPFSDLSIKEIQIENGITSIGKNSFRNCIDIEKVNIASTIISIRNGAFNNCPSITDVYFDGTDNEWNEIIIDGQNDCLTNASIHFNSTECEHIIVIDEEVPPTCSSTGLSTGSHCSKCGKITENQVVIDKLEHNYDNLKVNPTCVGMGYTVYICSNCSYSYKDDYVEATNNHILTSKTVVFPTCSSTGILRSECSLCDYYLEETIPALSHTIIIDEGKEANCLSSGLTQGSHCSVCGATIVQQNVIPRIDHKYIPTVIEPNCTNKGYTIFTCVHCKDSYQIDSTNPIGHKYDNGVTTVSPTCVKAGEKKYTCKNCKNVKKEKLNPTNKHTYDSSTTTKYPTCSNAGTKTYKCKYCTATKTETIKATGKHSYDKGKVTKKPTSKATGVLKYTCKTCKCTKTSKLSKLTNASIKKAESKSKSFKISWKKVSSATGYEIQYSEKKDYKKSKTITIKNNATTSLTVKKLQSKGKYYVRIRTYKVINSTTCRSSWSKSVSVKTK